MCSFFRKGPLRREAGKILSDQVPRGYDRRMMKKEEKEGALLLKKKSWETEAPKMQRMVPRIKTRGVKVGSDGSSVSGTTCET